MNKIIDRIVKSKILSIIILTLLAIILGLLLFFNSFRVYEIPICIGLGLLINTLVRKAFNKPGIKVSDMIFLSIGITLAMYAISH